MFELAIANRNINIADSNRFDNPFFQKNKKTFARACKCFSCVSHCGYFYALCDCSASACLSAIESWSAQDVFL